MPEMDCSSALGFCGNGFQDNLNLWIGSFNRCDIIRLPGTSAILISIDSAPVPWQSWLEFCNGLNTHQFQAVQEDRIKRIEARY
jgi:hypothetical protein